MIKVTDPEILAQLNGASTKVTDPAILAQLNGEEDDNSIPNDDSVRSPSGLGELEERGMFGRMYDDLYARGGEAADAIAAYKAGEQGNIQTGIQLVGKNIAGAGLDVVGEAIKPALDYAGEKLKPVGEVIADYAADQVPEGVKSAGREVADSSIIKKGIELAGELGDGYEIWTKENPNAARTVEALANIGLVAFPIKATPKTAMGKTPVGKAGDAITENVVKKTAQKKSDFVQELVAPKQTAKIKPLTAKASRQEGILGVAKQTPTSLEKSIIDDVSKLPVKSHRSPQYNLNVIQDAVENEAKLLSKTLGNSKIIFPRQEYYKALDDVVEKLADNPLLVGDSAKVAEKLVVKARKIFDEHPSTPKGLLDARKELDRYITRQKGKKAFDSDIDSALTTAIREVRQGTNKFLESKAPNVGIRESLKRQSNYFSAIDNVAVKAGEQGRNVITRQFRNLLKVIPLRGELAQTIALTGAVGTGAAVPVAGATALGTVAGYQAGKALIKPTKQALAKILKLTDKAIRTTSDKSLIKELRLGRVATVELMKNAPDEDELKDDNTDDDLLVDEPLQEPIGAREQPTQEDIEMLKGNPAPQEPTPEQEAVEKYQKALQDSEKFIPSFAKLSPNRQEAISELSFNLGYGKLSKLGKFKAAVEDGDFKKAGRELILSDWYKNASPVQRKRILNQIIRGN